MSLVRSFAEGLLSLGESLEPDGNQLSAILAAQTWQNLFAVFCSSGTTVAPKGLALTKVRWHGDSSSRARRTLPSRTGWTGGCAGRRCTAAGALASRGDCAGLLCDCQDIESALLAAMSDFLLMWFTAFQEDLRLAIRERIVAKSQQSPTLDSVIALMHECFPAAQVINSS
jgi:hypothetical protein